MDVYVVARGVEDIVRELTSLFAHCDSELPVGVTC